MKKAALLALVVSAALPLCAPAQQTTGSMAVTAVVHGSIGLRVQGTSEAAAESASVRVDRDADTVTLDVIRANVPQGAAVVVFAHLESAPSDGATWFIDGAPVSDARVAMIRVDGASPTVTLRIARGGTTAANRIVFAAHVE